MRLSSTGERECLRSGWHRWRCGVACPRACKRSSYLRAQEIPIEIGAAVAAQNAQAVWEATVWQISADGSGALSDENGLPLIWPRGQ